MHTEDEMSDEGLEAAAGFAVDLIDRRADRKPEWYWQARRELAAREALRARARARLNQILADMGI